MNDTATAEHAPATNGNGQTEQHFPVDSFREAAPHLRRPFTANAVKFKVQATWPKTDPTGGLIVGYIDARLVDERLNKVVPHLWHDEYEPAGQGHLLCRLTVDGITRQDVGQGVGKAVYSDALKRAAVKFGIGVSLYAIPKMILIVSDGAVKPRRSKDGMTLEITPAGERQLREGYQQWLDDKGIAAFGQPLDHGDVEGSQGDPEDQPQAEGDSEALGNLSPALVKDLRSAYRETGWNAGTLRLQLTAVDATDVSDVRKALAALTPDQAVALMAAMNAAVDARTA